jgi:hypothetical protein
VVVEMVRRDDEDDCIDDEVKSEMVMTRVERRGWHRWRF